MAERFKVHKMIESFTTGEDIDVDFLKELIAKDSLVDDLTMHIEDTKENKILTYRECVNLLNENEQLKKENEVLKSTNMEYEDALGRLEEENELLKEENEDLNEELMGNDSLVLLYKERRDKLKKGNNDLIHVLEKQSMVVRELMSRLVDYRLEEPIVLTKEDLEIMGKAISYYTHEELEE